MKRALLDYNLKELQEILVQLGEPPFRAKQVYQWLHKGVSFEEMHTLPDALRRKLREGYREGFLEVYEKRTSGDGTVKYLLKLADSHLIEAVLMSYEHGKTICITTQVGCGMACSFCASAIGGFVRNLSAGELLGQVLAVNYDMGLGRNLTNIVLMGTGEPMLNLENTVRFLELVGSEHGLKVSMRNISISTCGIVPGIYALADEGRPVTLCLSLHSAIDGKRREIMPIAQQYPLERVMRAMDYYGNKTGRRLIYEYILISGFNMGREDVQALKALLDGKNAHINLIPLNGELGGFLPPSGSAAYRFIGQLEQEGLSVTLRRTLGQDIEGACGQLRAKAMKEDR